MCWVAELGHEVARFTVLSPKLGLSRVRLVIHNLLAVHHLQSTWGELP